MTEMMLNVLIVEDAESDTHLIVHLLQKAGYDVNHIQVQAADEMRNALQALNGTSPQDAVNPVAWDAPRQ